MIEFREETHQYFVDGVEKRYWSQIAQAAGLIKLPDHPKAVENVINAKHRGRQIAQACCFFIRGQLDLRQLPDESLPYVQAFLEYWNFHGSREFVAETPLYNAELDYCTTPDFHRANAVHDVKATDRPSLSWGPQTAAQSLALNGGLARRKIVWLRPHLKTRKYEIIEPPDPRVFTEYDFDVVREAATGQYDGPAITAWKAMQNGRHGRSTEAHR